jgi:hypothetical protein
MNADDADLICVIRVHLRLILSKRLRLAIAGHDRGTFLHIPAEGNETDYETTREDLLHRKYCRSVDGD